MKAVMFDWKAWLLGIIVIAGILRLYQLGTVPGGLGWDEAAIGYNGYAVSHTLRDEWLKPIPISFKSYGDYKAPLAIYINGISTSFLGLNVIAIRLPFALAGIATVAGMYFLTKLLIDPHQTQSKTTRLGQLYGLFAAGLVMLSPWQFHFSRIAFESGMALAFTVWATVFFLYGLSFLKTKQPAWLLVISALLFDAALYTYHSSKVVVPLLILVLVILFQKTLRPRLKKLLLPFIVGSLGLVPLLIDSFILEGGARFSQTTVFSQNESLVSSIQTILNNTLSHFSFEFLFLGETTTLRHGDGRWGVLLITTGILIISNLKYVVIPDALKDLKKVLILGIFWTVIGILPAALGRDVPHSNRALLALPGLMLLAISGLHALIEVTRRISVTLKLKGSHGEKDLIPKTVVGIGVVIHVFLFMSYHRDYRTVYAVTSATEFQEGYQQLYEQIIPQEESYQQIHITTALGHPYIYALLFRQTSPFAYHGGDLQRYFFAPVGEADLLKRSTLIVAVPEEIELSHTTLIPEIIRGRSGEAIFYVFKTE